MERIKGEKEEQDSGVDQEVLDQIINKLYDFGDGPDDKRVKRKQKKRKGLKQEEEEEEEVTAEDENLTKLECKQYDSNYGHMTNTAAAPNTTAPNSATTAPNSATTAPNSATTAPNSATTAPNSAPGGVEIVTFQDPRKKHKFKRTSEAEIKPVERKETKKKEAEVLSIEKARLDVHRFGITGFQKQQQRVFEQDRAVMLGARPPKKEYVNYKVFQQMIKEKKMKEKQDMKVETSIKKKKSSGKQKNVKRQNGAEPTGQVGRFKNGLLLLNSRDIQKITTKTRK